MHTQLAAVLITFVALNLAASIAVLRLKLISSRERVLQLVMIWIVPLVGTVVALVFARSTSVDPFTPEKPTLKPGDGGVYEDADGVHFGADHH